MDEATISVLRGVLPLASAPLGAWAVLWAAGREGVGPGARLSETPPALILALLVSHGMALFLTPGWQLAASLALAWALIALAWIDWRRMLLPDFLTLPLTVLGLCVAWAQVGAFPADHALGALIGFAVIAALALAYRRLRGVEGMGLGDAKLLAAGGAWLGWQGLASMALVGALASLAYLAVERLRGRRREATEAVAFGPFLALGLWLVWLLGPLRLPLQLPL